MNTTERILEKLEHLESSITSADPTGVELIIKDLKNQIDSIIKDFTAIASVIGQEGWISVEERLPEDRWDEHQYPTISYPQNVVISTGKTYTAAYDREKKIWFVGNLLEYYEGKNIVDEPRIRVTHWQPLPAPPLSDLTPKTKEDGE
jgi:hypothetical protein